MTQDKETIREKLLKWDGILKDYSFPAWEDFPELPLYMDQVIYLLNQYLSFLPADGGERTVTPAMINNYVKMKIIPAPVRKRYGRTHLAYLMIVCVLKQVVNTCVIKTLLPPSPGEKEAQALYAEFARTYGEIKDYFRREVRRAAEDVFGEQDEPVAHLVFQASAAANLSKMFTEQLILLEAEPGKAAE